MTNRLRRPGNNPLARWLADDSFPPRPPDQAVYRYKDMIGCVPVLYAAVLARLSSA